ncbi:NADH-quinone oxidoreductase subunit L [Marinobacter salinisoli]|uniref:Probable inorganic carbon transporter subunit DabB n=1 Tax=Marinobacter salinisoli TaxID=2769486 RepID=A0ABX7MS40_9GAMM|nr:NADH-quinone oxidoreductase subunit L [Marinobacter salinisoli]QSP95094.1 NADH-quinone oxidoreductase subunit L [Marinobacter salinisoli]
MDYLSTGWLFPGVYIAGCLLAFICGHGHWRIARITAQLGLFAAVLSGAWALLPFDSGSARHDALGLSVAVLVALLGWVIIRFSYRYLQGEPGQPRFVRALIFTLACVSVLVNSQHLAAIALAWCGTSVGLHYLLTFYRERKAAQIVAHKKFIVSRLADLSLLIALALIYASTGSLTLDTLNTQLAAMAELPAELHIAAALFALAAILKSAQLPLHGWLIQVMEAPTPVSALLHAGVVNIGGLVLIRLADLISVAPIAQFMLVIVGGLTALLAGLVVITRISIKVRLAWSTCAQMGFMLMEVGLGLYELALLHLVAHSLYKAYAFLSSGDTVNEARRKDLFTGLGQSSHLPWLLAAPLVTAALVVGTVTLWQLVVPSLHIPTAALLIVTFGLAPLFWLEYGNGPFHLFLGAFRVLALTQLYFLWHLVFAELTPASAEPSVPLTAWVLATIGTLYVAQTWLRCFPNGKFAERFYPWAYCGFYLDETFTRLTFKLWPARLSPVQAQTSFNRHPAHLGATK